MDADVDGNNTRHYVYVSVLSKELGPDLCSALPGIHSFTGVTTPWHSYGKEKCDH